MSFSCRAGAASASAAASSCHLFSVGPASLMLLATLAEDLKICVVLCTCKRHLPSAAVLIHCTCSSAMRARTATVSEKRCSSGAAPACTPFSGAASNAASRPNTTCDTPTRETTCKRGDGCKHSLNRLNHKGRSIVLRSWSFDRADTRCSPNRRQQGPGAGMPLPVRRRRLQGREPLPAAEPSCILEVTADADVAVMWQLQASQSLCTAAADKSEHSPVQPITCLSPIMYTARIMIQPSYDCTCLRADTDCAWHCASRRAPGRIGLAQLKGRNLQ